MIKKASVFTLGSKKNKNAFELLLSEVRNVFGEPAVMDFTSPAELAQAAVNPQSETTVVAVSKEAFLKTKLALLKAFDIKIGRSNAIINAMGENSPANEKEKDLFSAIPAGARVYPARDGLYSAFSVQKGDAKLVFLPLDEKILGRILPEALTGDNPVSGFRKSIESVMKSGKKIAVAPCGSSKAVMKAVSSVEGYETCFTLAYGTSDGQSGEDKADYLARSAGVSKENTSSDFGAAMSEILADPESGEKYAVVCLADSERARVAKVYAVSGESDIQLAAAALIKLCDMMEETSEAGALIKPSETYENSKKISALPIIIAAVGILAAILICVVAMFAVRSNAANEKTRALISAKISTAVMTQSATEPVFATLPYTEDFRGGSGIGLDTEMFPEEQKTNVQETTTAETTEAVTNAPTSAPTKPVTAITVTQIITTAAATTQKPTAPPTTKASTQPATESSKVSGKFVFTCYGWGHGVGMSQYGAMEMARNGKNYEQILTHYFPGTTVKEDSQIPEKVIYGGTEYGLVEYLCKTSKREIGNGAPKEAIKAQIVAVYTYAKTYNFNVASSLHAFDASWEYKDTATYKACLEVLGMSSEEDVPKAKYVDYNGKPAFTCYFAQSAGKTTSASNAWGGNYPYLSGGASSPETVRKETVEISAEDLKAMILAYDPTIELSDNPAQWLEIVSHDSAYSQGIGYISEIRVGNKTMRGNRFRDGVTGYRLLSHCFTFVYIK